MPLVSKTFDQLLDFTRTTSGTFVGSNGLIQTTPASLNLLTWTQQFDNAAWNKSNATANANITTAPDDTATADVLVEDTTSGSHLFQQFVSYTSGVSYTLSFYVKAGTRSWVQIAFPNAAFTGAPASYYDLSGAGALGTASGSPTARTITDVGNGWHRITITATATATAGGNTFIRSATGDNAGVYVGVASAQAVFLWGAQLELGSTATTYTRNNGGVYPPRFDYDSVTLAPKGIMIEEQRTNLLLNSVFDGAVSGTPGTGPTSWTYSNVGGTLTVTDLGRNFASNSLRFTVTSDRQTLQQNVTLAATGTYVLSASVNVFVSCSLQQLFQFNPLPAGATIQYVYNGVNQIAGFAPPTGRGLLQVIITTTGTGGSLGIRVGVGTSGVITGDVSFQDVQIELGLFATSYIPTAGSTVTRAADQCSIVAPNFAPWYNQSEGTFVFEGTVLGATGFSWPLIASDNTAPNRFGMYRSSSSVAGFIIASNVTQMEVATTSVVANVPFKISVAAQTNNGNFSFNGNIGSTDTTITMPVVNKISLGSSASGVAEYLNGHIRSICYYPVRLSNAQLQALTA
ncbi:hypothetical protein UFOVP616_35 [uncultured Caudovirales phage]|uniref:Uncharacterized protein n=1 Tax=uncultured Caudovirales phage TaxID=2100421 RepID=A0A6J5N6Y5_9CAUD|nr:hypothetical protein UFOVP616_35 [uncultured Caudovirales phage]